MKHKSILRMLTACVLSCTLCCSGMTVPAFSVDETEELPARFDCRDRRGSGKPVHDNKICQLKIHLSIFTTFSSYSDLCSGSELLAAVSNP